jgi:hypothetical protein
MQFIILILLYDFMQVLNSIGKHYTNNKHFPKHILFLQFIYYKNIN